MTICAVLFDMDGLMIDSEPLAKEAWRQTVALYGHKIDEPMFDNLLGLRQIECAQFFCKQFALPQAPTALMRQRNEIFMDMLPGRVRAMPGLFELLDWLRSRGLLCALVTSGMTAYVRVVLRELALDGTFASIITGEDVPQGKPAPDCYLLAAERLRLSPRVCLALEDAPNGVAAAQAAGMLCWAVQSDHVPPSRLAAADRLLPSLLAVRDALSQYPISNT